MFIILVILNIVSTALTGFVGDFCYHNTTTNIGTCETLADCTHMIPIVKEGKPYKSCGFIGLDELVCCIPKEEPERTVSLLTPRLPQRLGRRISEIKCSEYATYVYEGTTNLCGFKVIGLLVGGTPANEKEFPHMALLGFGNGPHYAWTCGGTLISHEFVVTAAHCLFNPVGEVRKVRLGEHNKKMKNINREEYGINQTYVHPKYESALYYDIALIQLDRRVEFNSFIRPACLPTKFQEEVNFAIATGWGATSFSGPFADVLQKVTLDLFPDEECRTAFVATRLASDGLSEGINSTQQLCAGSRREEKDTCTGDSGGPLQVYRMSDYCMYTLIGITSFGPTCANVGEPGVYQRVYAYLDWIESIVW